MHIVFLHNQLAYYKSSYTNIHLTCTFIFRKLAMILSQGGSRGLVVKVLDSKFKGCELRPTLVTVRFRSLGNFVYPTLPRSTQL